MTESTVEHTYTLGFRNPEFEDYTDLATEEEVYAALLAECRTSVENGGSDAYDPGDFLPAWASGEYQDLADPAGDWWGCAHELAVLTAAHAEARRIWNDGFCNVVGGRDREAGARILAGTNIFLRAVEEER